MASKTPDELAKISKLYYQYREQIEAEILKEILSGKMQASIAKRFGMSAQQIHSRAKKAGINYYQR